MLKIRATFFFLIVLVVCYGCEVADKGPYGKDTRIINALEEYLGLRIGMTYGEIQDKAQCYSEESLRMRRIISGSVSHFICTLERDEDNFTILLGTEGHEIQEDDRIIGIITDSKKNRLNNGVGVGSDFATIKKVYGGLFSDDFEVKFNPRFVYIKNSHVVLNFGATTKDRISASTPDDSEKVVELFFMEKIIEPGGFGYTP